MVRIRPWCLRKQHKKNYLPSETLPQIIFTKIFFLDIGVRNALVDIASSMNQRNDKGVIFENFFVSERMKKGVLEIFPPEIMFWRTRTGQEIDVIEKNGPNISAFGCKWKDVVSAPKQFLKAYPNATFAPVNTNNLLSYV